MPRSCLPGSDGAGMGKPEHQDFFPCCPGDLMCNQVGNLWALPLMTLAKEPDGTQNASGPMEKGKDVEAI